ncbi:isopenicillin N synthase family dioxygenase [Coraliomargarita parva]|uniref:isopenicillin N synthase family dioxygenase n=1 Tax=Coraliomargarita parva TaxID=3014050 RepID=UPI0022B34524|nr:2OG-Fe(II) oxygenase family protein [Coraliomargarita parva]
MSIATTIPIVDMAPYLEGTPEGKAQVATEIYNAAHNVGFTYLKNFGMSEDLLEAAFKVSQSVFNCDEKFKVPFNPEANHGFTQMKGEALDPTKPADLKETFTCRNLANQPSGPDYWPNPQFEAFMRVFHARIVKIAADIMGAFALALGLEPDYFDKRHTGLTQTLRLLHYPPVEEVAEGQLGAGAHTDYGTITVLFQDPSGGLQVQNLAGEWIDAPPIPGTVVINTGDLISRWSNDFFKSTPHRVVPRPAAMKNGRLSIAFFSDPDPEVMIETFPNCITEANPAKYAPITAGEHIRERIMASQAKA